MSTYHAPDCGGWPACNGCGWIDSTGHWQPGPCPPSEQPVQVDRSEGIHCDARSESDRG
jgi:hypothetical protein